MAPHRSVSPPPSAIFIKRIGDASFAEVTLQPRESVAALAARASRELAWGAPPSTIRLFLVPIPLEAAIATPAYDEAMTLIACGAPLREIGPAVAAGVEPQRCLLAVVESPSAASLVTLPPPPPPRIVPTPLLPVAGACVLPLPRTPSPAQNATATGSDRPLSLLFPPPRGGDVTIFARGPPPLVPIQMSQMSSHSLEKLLESGSAKVAASVAENALDDHSDDQQRFSGECVRWISEHTAGKGSGRIRFSHPDGTVRDIFVYQSNIEMEGFRHLSVGDKVRGRKTGGGGGGDT